ncbi:CDP-diacylglycerol--glycerol-3-phosphate 3-phosphatidyltransferase [Streptomyces sp. A012304]|uniref:CDP-diacylglycerol--glycerol-3-phosphate 3-phosphatidyltransferase n=1 Tax=Streptomyces sp. A012304 TaxID=375446 RepID=UPI00222F2BB4|nr:CDP-diacylglycerol--glycerol-3-phosphate 3-phosphatidyltransferase [Streptomyces sp. A012304]
MTGVPASAAGGSSPAKGVAAAASDASSAAGASDGASSAPGVSGGASGVPRASGEASAVSGASGGGSADSGGGSAASSGEPVPSSGASAASGGESAGSGGDGVPGGGRTPRGGKIAAAAVNQASVWNIANLLTMLRLILVPGFVALMLADGGYDPAWRSFAWAAFAIAMITDLFDGHLARTYNLVTDFGKIADPIADKAIMGAALICLSALGDLPWWVTIVILGRELGVTLLRFWVIRYGVIPASRGGKLKTLTQGVAVGMYVLALTGWLATLRFWVMAAAVVLTVVTGLDYVRQAIVLRRQGIAERKAASEETEA